jgi:hypothetical protein
MSAHPPSHPTAGGLHTHKVDVECALAALRSLDLVESGSLGLLCVCWRALGAHGVMYV